MGRYTAPEKVAQIAEQNAERNMPKAMHQNTEKPEAASQVIERDYFTINSERHYYRLVCFPPVHQSLQLSSSGINASSVASVSV